MVDCGFISTFHSKILNITQHLVSKKRLYNIGFETKKSELSNSKKQNGQDLCSIPRSCYDRRVSKTLFQHFVIHCATQMSPIIFLFQHQPPRPSCRCHQGQTWRRFRQGRLQVRLSRWLIVWHNHTVIQLPVHLFWQTNTHLTKTRVFYFFLFGYSVILDRL